MKRIDRYWQVEKSFIAGISKQAPFTKAQDKIAVGKIEVTIFSLISMHHRCRWLQKLSSRQYWRVSKTQQEPRQAYLRDIWFASFTEQLNNICSRAELQIWETFHGTVKLLKNQWDYIFNRREAPRRTSYNVKCWLNVFNVRCFILRAEAWEMKDC